MGAFDDRLIGRTSISFEVWKTQADADLTELKAKIQSDNQPDWMIMMS